MASCTMLMLLSSLAFVFIQRSKAAKIVGYPMFGGSQYLGMKRISEDLASRGHEVTLLVSSIQKLAPSDKVKHGIYKVPYDKGFVERELISKVIKGGIREIFNPNGMPAIQRAFCEALLNDTELLETFKNHDLIITDCSMFCGPIVADYLGLLRVEYCPASPRVPLMTYHHAQMYPSYVPQMMSNNPAHMNFLQRVKNTLVCGAAHMFMYVIFLRGFEDIKTRYNIKPERSFVESMGDAELVLLLADFALDYPHPVLPGHKLIGPVNIQPPKPLPPDLQQLMDSSGDDGVIIVSFGSNVASALDSDKVDLLADAFGRLKEKVIWRLTGYIPPNLGANIKTVKWLPQNDLLAHKKLRVFVSHVGQNSLYESSWRGVPLVAVPLFADQPDNAILVEEKGLGLRVNIHTVTADQLYKTIRRVIDEPRFKANAERISLLMNDRPRTPVQEAADWVEYTLRHGRLTHLRPYSVHLTWYQYFLVDVMLFLALVLVLVVMVIRLMWRCVCRLCCRRPQKTKTQ